MPVYIGFSTQNVCQVRENAKPGVDGGVGNLVVPPTLGKKFRQVDTQLVVQDFKNAFNIKQGDKVGQPEYGTTLWNFVFEPNTSDVREAIETEVRRVAGLDPRLTLGPVAVYWQDNGVLIETEVAISPYNNVVQIGLFLNRFDGSIQQLTQ